MQRKWLVIPDDTEGEIEQIDVVPGVEINGQKIFHGHTTGSDCDCRPQVVPNLDTVIIVHKADA